jgi:adenosylmethionine-8-amino-7-oxononanoate aminotransferase
MAAGAAVLERIRSAELVKAADSEHGVIGKAFSKALRTLAGIPCVGDVRGLGMLWGLEFVEDCNTKQPFAPEKTFSSRVAAAALKRGLMTYPMQGCVDGKQGDHILLAPPATDLRRLLDGVDLLGEAVREASDQATRL